MPLEHLTLLRGEFTATDYCDTVADHFQFIFGITTDLAVHRLIITAAGDRFQPQPLARELRHRGAARFAERRFRGRRGG